MKENSHKQMNDINWLEKTKESYNVYYKCYRAAWCRKSGLPMLDSSTWEQIQTAGLYTISRARKNHIKMLEDDAFEPAAF